MRNLLRLLMVFFSAFMGIHAQKHSLEKGFQALERKNFGIAQEIFCKASATYPSVTALGMTKLYFQTKEFYKLDSAWYFVNQALKGYSMDLKKFKQKHAMKFEKKGWDPPSLNALRTEISLAMYTDFIAIKNLHALTKFLDEYPDFVDYQKALRFRDSLWLDACSGNDLFCLLGLKAASSSSSYNEEILQQIDVVSFENWVKTNSEEELETFIQYHPESKFVAPVQDELYHQYLQREDTVYFKVFLTKYASNRNCDKMWKVYFDASIGNYDSVRMVSFINRYPEYPYKNAVLQELKWFRNQLYPIANKQDQYGFMDEEGGVVIDCQYEEVNEFHEGLAAVMKNGKYGTITPNNEVAVHFNYDLISDYQSGCAIIEKNRLFGLIDRSGKILIQPTYSEMQFVFSDLLLYKEKERFGLMTTKEQKIIESTFTEFLPLNDQYAVVSNEDGSGILHASLKLLISCEYEEITLFANGFMVKKKGQWGVIDFFGRTVIPVVFDEIYSTSYPYLMVKKANTFFHISTANWNVVSAPCPLFDGWKDLASFDGRYFLCCKKGNYFWLDSSLKVVKPLKMFMIQQVAYCMVGKQKSTDLLGISDRQGVPLSKFIYSEVQFFSNGFMKVIHEGKMGLYSTMGTLITEAIYDNIIYWPEVDLFLTEKDGYQGVINPDGKVILPNKYSSIKVYSNQILALNQGNKLLYLNFITGKLVKPKE